MKRNSRFSSKWRTERPDEEFEQDPGQQLVARFVEVGHVEVELAGDSSPESDGRNAVVLGGFAHEIHVGTAQVDQQIFEGLRGGRGKAADPLLSPPASLQQLVESASRDDRVEGRGATRAAHPLDRGLQAL